MWYELAAAIIGFIAFPFVVYAIVRLSYPGNPKR